MTDFRAIADMTLDEIQKEVEQIETGLRASGWTCKDETILVRWELLRERLYDLQPRLSIVSIAMMSAEEFAALPAELKDWS